MPEVAISPELVLVSPELAARARGALPEVTVDSALARRGAVAGAEGAVPSLTAPVELTISMPAWAAAVLYVGAKVAWAAAVSVAIAVTLMLAASVVAE